MLDELKEPMAERGIKFGYDGLATRLIAQKAYGKAAGARDIRQFIRRNVEDQLTLLLVEAGENPPGIIHLSREDEELKLQIV